MWQTPMRLLPEKGEPVVCVTAGGMVIWLKRLDDGWRQTDAQGRDCGFLLPEPIAWAHPPQLPEVTGAERAKRERYRKRLHNSESG